MENFVSKIHENVENTKENKNLEEKNVSSLSDLYVKNNLEWENLQANEWMNKLIWNIEETIENKKWYYLTELYIKSNLADNWKFKEIFDNLLIW